MSGGGNGAPEKERGQGREWPAEERIRTLLVDDEPNVLASLARILRRKGFEVTTTATAEDALRLAVRAPEGRAAPAFDVVLADLRMPGMDGLQLISELRRGGSEAPVVVLTGYGTIRSAVEAIRQGAFEYLVKPSSPEEVIAVLRRAASGRKRGGPDAPPPASTRAPVESPDADIVCRSEVMATLLEMVRRVAPIPLPVLLLGESGTGKELLARTVHRLGPRAQGPFIAVNCASITPGLAESLLFGYRKGAFSGAEADREGFFQAASGGTLFLDELGDFPETAQGVVLRALQEQAVTPVGATRPTPIDVRIVSATNREIDELVRQGRFRTDLLYRINAVQLHVPPLRERPEDIAPLTDTILQDCSGRYGLSCAGISEVTLRRLLTHTWPGNVRELRNVLERALAVCGGGVIEESHLPSHLQERTASIATLSQLDATELGQIRAALTATGGEKKAAAQLLGIDRKRLYRKLRKLGLYA